jgi:hypothetical protein
MSSAIDRSDPSIISNSTSLRIISEYIPRTLFTNYSIEQTFNNSLVADVPISAAPSITEIARYKPAVTSSSFNYNGQQCVIQDNGNGRLDIVNISATRRNVISSSIGTINYTTGKFTLVDFGVDSYVGSAIKFYGRPTNTNIVANKNLILALNTNDVAINVNGISATNGDAVVGSISTSSAGSSSGSSGSGY